MNEVFAGLYGTLAAQGVLARVDREISEQEAGPCTCGEPSAFYLTLLANPGLRDMLVEQGEADDEAELLEWYKTEKTRDGCGSHVCISKPCNISR